MTRILRPALVALGLILALAGLWQLEEIRGGIPRDTTRIGTTPATVYSPPDGAEAGTVLVTHGFGGSRRMMEAISLSLARAGLRVVAIEFRGHGRNPVPMSPDILRIEGTTADLVAETVAAIDALDRPPVALLGHSMATDVILRAGIERGIGTIVAISMYSETITPERPEALLVVSGGFEKRLRGVAREAVEMIDPGAGEGETARAGEVRRRAVAAPGVGHVGVLWSPVTAREAVAWILPEGPPPDPARTWPAIAALQGGILLAGFALLSGPPAPGGPVGRGTFLAALGAGALGAATGSLVFGPAFGLAGMGGLAGALAGWGLGAFAVLFAAGHRPGVPRAAPAATLLVAGLVYALALDQASAAFLPAGPRLPLACLLAVAALPFTLADAHLAYRAALWRRVLARLVFLVVLGGLMALRPATLGLNFTALVLIVLWLLVYGWLGRRAARFAGPATAGWALAPTLGWSLGAALPLFAAP